MKNLVRWLFATLLVLFSRFLIAGSPGITGVQLIFGGIFLLVFVFCLSYFNLKKNVNKIGWGLIHLWLFFSICCYSNLIRLHCGLCLEQYLSACLIFFVLSSESSGNESAGSLPQLESSSSSESLNAFRENIGAENEREIFARLQNLENQDLYNVPPQNNLGEYARLVREHFDQAINVEHYRQIWDREFSELQVLERKGLLQDRLQNIMLAERNLDQILELSPYSCIKKEAYSFIEDRLSHLSDLRYPYQRHLMDGSLNSFLHSLNEHGINSEIYRDFYRHFTDETFRRMNGLPLPNE